MPEKLQTITAATVDFDVLQAQMQKEHEPPERPNMKPWPAGCKLSLTQPAVLQMPFGTVGTCWSAACRAPTQRRAKPAAGALRLPGALATNA